MPKTKVRLKLDSNKIKAANFPDSVPILAASNFCKHVSYQGRKMCLSARSMEVFIEEDSLSQHAAHSIVDQIMKGVIKDEIKNNSRLKGIPVGDVIGFNDHPKTTMEDVARVWNRTMAACGYTEGNPAARTIESVPALA